MLKKCTCLTLCSLQNTCFSYIYSNIATVNATRIAVLRCANMSLHSWDGLNSNTCQHDGRKANVGAHDLCKGECRLTDLQVDILQHRILRQVTV